MSDCEYEAMSFVIDDLVGQKMFTSENDRGDILTDEASTPGVEVEDAEVKTP